MKTDTKTPEYQDHTPGPWTAQGHEIYSDTRYVGRAYDWSNPICDPEYSKINDELRAEGEANARLMACAPELFSALSGMMREFDYLDARGAEKAALLNARAVLDRANGVAHVELKDGYIARLEKLYADRQEGFATLERILECKPHETIYEAARRAMAGGKVQPAVDNP